MQFNPKSLDQPKESLAPNPESPSLALLATASSLNPSSLSSVATKQPNYFPLKIATDTKHLTLAHQLAQQSDQKNIEKSAIDIEVIRSKIDSLNVIEDMHDVMILSGFSASYAQKMTQRFSLAFQNQELGFREKNISTQEKVSQLKNLLLDEKQSEVQNQFQQNFGGGSFSKIQRDLGPLIAEGVTGLSSDKLERMTNLLRYSPFSSRFNTGNIDHLYAVFFNMAAIIVAKTQKPLLQNTLDDLIFQTFATDIDLKGCDSLIRQSADYVPLIKHNEDREQNFQAMLSDPFPGGVIGHGLTSFDATMEFASIFYGESSSQLVLHEKALLGFLAKVIHHPTDFPATFLHIANLKPDFSQVSFSSINHNFSHLPSLLDKLYSHALSVRDYMQSLENKNPMTWKPNVDAVLGEIATSYPDLENIVQQFYCDDMGQLQPTQEGLIQSKWVNIKMKDLINGFNPLVIPASVQSQFDQQFPRENGKKEKQGAQLIHFLKVSSVQAVTEGINSSVLYDILSSSLQQALVGKLRSYIDLSQGNLSDATSLLEAAQELLSVDPSAYNQQLACLISNGGFSGKDIVFLNSIGSFAREQHIEYEGISFDLPAILPKALLSAMK